MFFTPDLTGIRFHDPNKAFHHWCPRSEVYAATSQLLSAINIGWQVNQRVIWQAIAFAGNRQACLYYFELHRDGEFMTMPVLENPALLRLLFTQSFEVEEYVDYYQDTGYAIGD